jgi:hypothetical protein
MQSFPEDEIIYPKTYSLTSQVYLDRFNKCYRNIVAINLPPEGPLSRHVRRVHLPRVSPFQERTACYQEQRCIFAVTSLRQFMGANFGGCSGSACGENLMSVDEIPDLISFLTVNGYNIDTKITKMMFQGEVKPNDSKLICYLTYIGRQKR